MGAFRHGWVPTGQSEGQSGQDPPFPARTLRLKFGAVDRPSLFKHPAFPFLVVAALAAAVFLLWQLWHTALLQHPALWAIGSIAIFWFSVSGGGKLVVLLVMLLVH